MKSSNMSVKFCYSYVKEDEYHFSLVCPFYRTEDGLFFKNYYFSWQNVHKFNLMQTKSTTILEKVAKYLIEAFEKRNCHV